MFSANVFRTGTFGAVSTVFLFSLFVADPIAVGQSSDAASDRERITAERYLQVLLRRPRPGVALDRVYGFHVQNDSLDSLQADLLANPNDDDFGSRQMVWGLIQMQRGKPAEAAEILQTATTKLTDDAACHFYLGKAFLAVGKIEQAAEAMERAIELKPARAEALPMFTELGRIYSRAGELDKSLSVWTRLEELFPGDTRVGGQIARTLADEGNAEEARKRYSELATLARSPDTKVAFSIQAAEMLRKLGKSDEALGEFEVILKRLRPGSWLYSDVRNRIEAGFLKSGDYDALAEYYQKQLNGRDDDLALQNRLARILVTGGRLQEAKTLLEAIVERAPDDDAARLTLVDVLVTQNDIEKASEQFEELVKRDPENPDHLMRWGQVLLEDTKTPLDQRREGAAGVWSRLADARSDDAVTLSQVADNFRSIDRADDAIDLYRKAIDIDPVSPQYREYLGEYLHSLDRTDEAIEVWNSIAEDDRKNRENLVRLAEVFGTFKLEARALESWEAAAEFDLTFAQELRYATKLGEAKRYDDALNRLGIAAKIAESPDEREQLLHEQIAIYQASGTITQEIEKLNGQPESVAKFRTLAMMYGAAGDLQGAERAVRRAMELEPDNSEVLLVAADIAERQNRFGDAADLFQRLSDADNRYRSNYLQRVASLRVRLGQIDKALATCEAIIDANPASPESYMFLARTAFGINHDEQAIAALRRAMSVAPRDNSPRRMLASHFASRYRTDEAIDLYWQVYQNEVTADDKISVIKSLAPLYDRKADIETLLGRIDELNRKEGDNRIATLMVAATHEAVENFGDARNAIDQLLAQQPRDMTLLESMVRLSDAADDVELAAEYQGRITDLANTPENRFKLVQYQLDAGLIDVSTALSQRISMLSDPSRLGRMIRSAVRRNDIETAQAICREAISADGSLWDLKLTLAQLLIYNRSVEDYESNRDQAVKLVREVRDAGLASDTLPPTQVKAPTAGSNPQSQSSSRLANPMYWSNSSYQLASMMRVGRYASSNYSYYRTNLQLAEPTSYGHARVIASTILVMNSAIGKSGDELTQAVDEIMSEIEIDDLTSIDDPVALWEQFSFINIRSYVSTTGNTPSPISANADEALRKRTMDLQWRLVEVDPNYGMMPIIQTLSQRMRSAVAPPGQEPDMEPLSDERLELLSQINAQVRANGLPKAVMAGVPAGVAEMMLNGILANEFRLAGKTEEAKQYAPKDLPADANFAEVMSAIQFHISLEEMEKADKLVERLLPAARLETGGSTGASYSRSMQLVSRNGSEATKEFMERNRLTLFDATIARWTLEQSAASRRSTTLGSGYIDTYYQSPTGNYQSIRLRGPLSERLLNSSLMQQVTGFLAVFDDVSGGRQMTTMNVREDVLEHLLKPLDGASEEEQKVRSMLAAFSHWWANKPQKCFESLDELAKAYPADVDIQIERARLASELKQPRLALDVLDSFSPLDSKMLIRKEMAAMNLAAEIGDTQRAKLAAERLFGMRLDVNTQLALADQLKRLGLNERAEAMLQRSRTGKARDENTQLRIAESFLMMGKKETAAEVAYSLMRRLSSGRSTQRNSTSYRQRAVSILKSAGRLEPLIQRAERRVEAAPKATRPKMELAELYSAAGRQDDASKVWSSLEGNVPNNAQQLITRAAALGKAKKYNQAIELYLKAFEKEPQRMDSEFYNMTNMVRRGGDEASEFLFKAMKDFPVDTIPSYRIDEITRLGSRNELSDDKREFIARILKSNFPASEIYNVVRGLPQEHKKQLPEYRQVMLTAVCGTEAFQVNSPLWQVRTRGSGGKAYGPLEDIVLLLGSDENAAKEFREAAEKAQETESQQASAKFLVALLDVYENKRRDEAIKVIRETVTPENDKAPTIVSDGLLWQAGQVLETVNDFPEYLLVDVLSEARRTSTLTSSSGPQYTVAARLVTVLGAQKRHGEVRELLMEMYPNVDNSQQNQYNPGYGDYQDLRTYKWLVEQLVVGNPIDALIVCRKALSDAAKFERAKRYGGSSYTKEAFGKLEQDAIKKITSEVAADYLISQVASWEENADSGDVSVDLMDVAVEAIGQIESPSSLSLAIGKALEDESQKERVLEFERRVGTLSKDDDNWEIVALQLMLACHLQSDAIATTSDRLFEVLPDEDVIRNTQQRDEAVLKYRELLDLYSVAKVASSVASEASRDQAERITNFLKAVADVTGETSIGIALAQVSGNPEESINRALDIIESTAKLGEAQSESVVAQCLSIATKAAELNRPEAAIRAIRLALSGGPPLRKINAGRDAFAISQSTSSNSNNDQDAELDSVSDQLHLALDALAKSVGVSLTTKALAEPAEDDPAPVVADASIFQALTDALLEVALPPEREGLAFLYPKRIAGTSYDRFRNAKIDITSASFALAVAASRCDRSEEVYQAIEKRFETSTVKNDVAVALVQIAAVSRDFERLDQAIDRLTQLLDADLPPADVTLPTPESVNLITSQMQTDSRRKSRIVDAVMQATWPIVRLDLVTELKEQSDSDPKAFVTKLVALFNRTNNLIQSDGYTANRHREISQRLLKQFPIWAPITGDEKTIDLYIDQATRPPTSLPSSDVESYIRSTFERAILQLFKEDLSQNMDKAIRHGVVSRADAERDYRDRFEPHICMEIARLPVEQRVKLLTRITIGRTEKEPVAFLCGAVRYEVPPSLVLKQLPRVEDAYRLREFVGEYPIVNSLVMLADSAVEAGAAERLVETFTSLSQTAGDHADIAQALIRLTIAKNDPSLRDSVLQEIAPTLEAVKKNVADNLPTARDPSLTFPELEMQLAVRAMEVGMPPKQLETLLNNIKMYAVRSSRNHLISSVARVLAQAEIGRAAGGRETSPLKHFDSVPIPGKNQPDEPLLPPLYASNAGGFISGTSGYDQSHLMFKYPLTGSFTFSAKIRDGGWGETDVAYGGVIYQPSGWKQEAQVVAMGYRGNVVFPVPSIKKGVDNVESVSVSPEGVAASCNEETYLTDKLTHSYPWVSIPHHRYRTTQFSEVKIVGNPVIPKEVNLIDETMRGWAPMATGGSLSKMLLPIGPKQNRKQIESFREKMEADLAKGPLVGAWSVVEEELHYKSKPSNQRDSTTQLQYLRPVQDGETLAIEFFWKTGKIEFAPTIGRMILYFSEEGTSPGYISSGADLCSIDFVSASSLKEKHPLIAPKIVPNDDAWNSLTFHRNGNELILSLNDQEFLRLPVRGYERPGVYRPLKRDVHIRSMKLTGDWPDKVPADLMERND